MKKLQVICYCGNELLNILPEGLDVDSWFRLKCKVCGKIVHSSLDEQTLNLLRGIKND